MFTRGIIEEERKGKEGERICVYMGLAGCRVVVVAKNKLDCHFILHLISGLFFIIMHVCIYIQNTPF